MAWTNVSEWKVELPSLVTWQNACKEYLLYRYQKDEITYGLLHFVHRAQNQAADLAAQFEFEKAKTWDNLYHIKSRYNNNKYFGRWTPDSEYITASAYAPDETKSSWTCTLFEPEIIGKCEDKILITLRHVQLDRYVSSSRRRGTFQSCLFVTKEQDHPDHFTLVDWEFHSKANIKLPKRVAFQAIGGKFLGACDGPKGEQYYLKFAFDSKDDPKVVHEIIPTPEGILYIKSAYKNNEFWKTTHNNTVDVIVAEANDPTSPATKNVAAMFRLVVVDAARNYIALQNMNSSHFCRRIADGNYKDYLGDTDNLVDEAATFLMVDLDKNKKSRTEEIKKRKRGENENENENENNTKENKKGKENENENENNTEENKNGKENENENENNMEENKNGKENENEKIVEENEIENDISVGN